MEFLRIKMNTKSIDRQSIGEEYKLLGGRALIAKMAYDEIPTLCHPLGPNNKLIITTSPLAGYGISSVGRLSVGGKSPLTGGIKESNGGGNAGNAIAKHGIRAIILEGLPEKDELYILKISGEDAQEKAELIPAEKYRNKGTFDTCNDLLKAYGKRSSIIVIGQAGEYFLAGAGVFITDTDGKPTRACARGGMGAVMGKKGIKAIVIQNDAAYKLEFHDKEAFERQKRLFHQAVLQHPRTKGYAKYGTVASVLPINAMGGLPTYNFRQGTWGNIEKLSAETIRETIIKRGGDGVTSHSCMNGCVIRCSNKFADENGKMVVSPLELENIILLGPNIGIDDLDTIGKLNYMCNDFGVDTIETGAALGVAADLGLFKFGDKERALELLQEIGDGTPLGRIIGSGASIVGKVYGHIRVPVVKNQAMAAHEPRNIKGMSATYATSPMGADHTAGVTWRLQMDHRKWEGAIDISRDIQVTQAFYDSYCCMFLSKSFSKNVNLFLDFLKYVYGSDLKPDYITKMGKEVLRYEYAFNEASIYTDNSMPEFMKYEGIAPDNSLSDIPQSEYDRFWDEEYFGKFPHVKKW